MEVNRVTLLVVITKLVIQINPSFGALLPKPIETCKLSDPDLDDCLKLNAKRGLEAFKNGNAEFGLLPLDPMTLNDIYLPSGKGAFRIEQKYTDLILKGLSSCTFLDYIVDIDNMKAHNTMNCEFTDVAGKFNISGQALALPIKATGPFEIRTHKPTITSHVNMTMLDVNGKRYFQMKDMKLKITPGKIDFSFASEGQKGLGEQISQFLEKNSELIYEEMHKPFEEAFAKVFTAAANQIFGKIPTDIMFPDDLERIAAI